MTTRNALAFIFVTILIDRVGFGIIIPVVPASFRWAVGAGGLARTARPVGNDAG